MSEAQNTKTKKIRVWADGCFDITHWGHMNALRQAKQLGDILIVGVHSDKEILKHKGPPVMNQTERYEVVRACKWVDEVVENAPYSISLETLDKHNIDFCVHGEDITTDANGVDCYAEVKKLGRYKTISRTYGVSTTDIVGRMILMTKDHIRESGAATPAQKSPSLPTTSRIVEFSNRRTPNKSDTIVYLDGSFDLFHAGHVDVLKKAKSLGSFLIVGVHNDSVINRIKGENRPIMNTHERVLSVLACRYVDNVIIGAPWELNEEMIKQFNIKIVVRGNVSDYPETAPYPYLIAQKLGLMRVVESSYPNLSTDTIFEKILNNLESYKRRNDRKKMKDGQI